MNFNDAFCEHNRVLVDEIWLALRFTDRSASIRIRKREWNDVLAIYNRNFIEIRKSLCVERVEDLDSGAFYYNLREDFTPVNELILKLIEYSYGIFIDISLF